MSEAYKTYDGGLFFVTLTVVGWIDVFTRKEYADELIRNLQYCQKKKGLELYSYCIMPSHLHMIAAAEQGNLGLILRDFKSYTAMRLLNMIHDHPQESRKEWMEHLFHYYGRKSGQERQFWQHTNHAIDLTTPEATFQKQAYIHLNPVEAGLVLQEEHYPYSSACPQSVLKMLPLG